VSDRWTAVSTKRSEIRELVTDVIQPRLPKKEHALCVRAKGDSEVIQRSTVSSSCAEQPLGLLFHMPRSPVLQFRFPTLL
jgi:hypothetical protein